MQILRTNEWVKHANLWLEANVKACNAQSLFLPAGETPKALYKNWREHPPLLLERLKLFQVDDVIEGPAKEIFAKFFKEELPKNIVEPPTKDIQADIAILGLGTNGHLAFHEPGIPDSFRFGEVSLHADTAARLNISPGTKARTFGLGAFMATKAVLLIVIGESKRKILNRFLDKAPELPASGLHQHKNILLLTDLQ